MVPTDIQTWSRMELVHAPNDNELQIQWYQEINGDRSRGYIFLGCTVYVAEAQRQAAFLLLSESKTWEMMFEATFPLL